MAGRYVLCDEGTVAFEVADYDHNKELVIDPVISYSRLALFYFHHAQAAFPAEQADGLARLSCSLSL